MNEEQPTFKVTDRRLFNADGSLRDLPAEETPEPKPAEPKPEPQPEQTSGSASDDKSTAPKPPASAVETQDKPGIDVNPPTAEQSNIDEPELTEEELADAQDPASFISFVMSIASNAASALGMMEHPVTHQREVDPELGKHWIDILGMLQKKTTGNLTPAERNMLEGLLHDLRMQYVALINAPQKARSFSGRDITGG